MLIPLEYTAYDLDESLTVAAKIYDVSDGTAAIDSTVALSHVVNGTYWGNFTSDDTKAYVVNIAPYSDGTAYSTVNPEYSPASFAIRIRDLLFKANTAFSNFIFPMYDEAGELITGRTVTAERSIDGSAFAACSGTVSEIGSGAYKINLSAGDLNGENIMLKFSASGARTNVVSIYTQS